MIAYTEKLGFDVLTAPIAEVDRRALSQAWFSALHLGGAQPAVPLAQAPVNGRSAHVAAGRKDFQTQESERGERIHTEPRMAVSRARDGNNLVQDMRVERRAPTSVLARRIERALLNRHVRRGTFVLDGMDGRVHVSIRSQGDRVHIVAVCAPHAKAYVEQALQHARFALARKGIVFKSSLREKHDTHPFVGGDVR